MRRLAFVCGLLMALSALGMTLSGLLSGMGTSSGWLLYLMRRHAPSAATGLPEEDYAPMAQTIADYLAGRSDVFQYTLERRDGVRMGVFHDYEQAHMADCRELFRLDRAVLLGCALVLALSSGLCAFLHRPRAAAGGCLTGCLLLLAALLGLGVWGLVNFDGLFVTFHKTFFRNGLWLLDPVTDMLVRLMPLPFFTSCAAAVLLTLAAALALLLGLSVCILRRRTT